MSISLNNIITYGEAKFKVVRTATSKDIDTLNTKINEISTIFRKNSTTYAVGDIEFSPSLPSSLLLECTVAGTTAATEPDFSGAAEGGTVTDGTVVWTYKGLLSDDGANKDLSNLTQDGEDHFLKKDFAIIYPNGGTAASPANVTTDSRYVESNPFPGYVVRAIVEVKQNNEWCEPLFYNYYGSRDACFGTYATQLNDGNIVIQTGSYGVCYNPNITCNGFSSIQDLYSAPCRVKVFKIGKVASA